MKFYPYSSLRFFGISIFFLCVFWACTTTVDYGSLNTWKDEIRETEKAFSALAGEKGIHEAFVTYAAEEAVLMRNNQLIQGKKAIDQFYQGQTSTGLSWEPDFVDVALSGDLGYTYGHYTFVSVDSSGQETRNTGIFHTVWKRQKDGVWRFVWD